MTADKPLDEYTVAELIRMDAELGNKLDACRSFDDHSAGGYFWASPWQTLLERRRRVRELLDGRKQGTTIMSDFSEQYTAVAGELKRRILALIPAHPGILEMGNAWQLFKVAGFHCEDLAPSMAQAHAALSEAKAEYRAGVPREG